jgi:nucleoside-diphosphate-sugar epimerase
MPAITVSDGPVAVTGASGYNGAHVVTALVRAGYTVRACVTDPDNPAKVDHLLALNESGQAGKVELLRGNLLETGSYDEPFAGCSAVFHLGTVMGYDAKNNPRQIYDGAVEGTRNILSSLQKAATVKRLIYTSSFAAISHPSKGGYPFTEADWAGDNRDRDQKWSRENIDSSGEVAYAMAKVDTEKLVYSVARQDGSFDAISVCPLVVLGPLLSKAHDLVYSWQWFLGRMLAGGPCERAWQHLWNVVDVRDVAQAQVLIAESSVCSNGTRYQLTATDESGELNVHELQAHLLKLFPDIASGGAPDAMADYIERRGSIFDVPRAHCDKARSELGLETHSIEDTLRATGESLIDLQLIEPAWK